MYVVVIGKNIFIHILTPKEFVIIARQPPTAFTLMGSNSPLTFPIIYKTQLYRIYCMVTVVKINHGKHSFQVVNSIEWRIKEHVLQMTMVSKELNNNVLRLNCSTMKGKIQAASSSKAPNKMVNSSDEKTEDN